MRSSGMDMVDRTLLIVGTCGAFVAAGMGALAGSGLRVTVPVDVASAESRVFVGTDEVFTDGAPAYPTWAPEPLYPRAERDPMAEFSAAWDEAMSDVRDPRPVAFRAPQDLPLPYEVRLRGEERPGATTRDDPRGVATRSPGDGRHAYGGQGQSGSALDDGKTKT